MPSTAKTSKLSTAKRAARAKRKSQAAAPVAPPLAAPKPAATFSLRAMGELLEALKSHRQALDELKAELARRHAAPAAKATKKKRGSIAARALAFVIKHPNCTSGEIKKGIGLTKSSAVWYELWERGALRRRLNSNGVYIYRAAV